jgi:alkylation response protein AidB-like acyl-CoA dehydrogenase
LQFTFSESQRLFQSEVQEFVRNEWHRPSADLGAEDETSWQAHREFRSKLARRGWLTLAWPKEWGGAGASPVQQAIYNEVMGYYGAPAIDMGADRIGPTLMMFGTDEQKKRFLPGITSGESNWCQGFSEPNAGSDLAALRTRATLDGDHFVVNGQKIWTSNAHHADWMLLLVRTDPEAPKHRGISVLLVDVRSPGIEIKPLLNLSGSHGFNEVFFEDVRVPRSHLVGELNRGWYIAAATLDFERSGIGRIAAARGVLDDATELVKALPQSGSRITYSRQLAELRIEYEIGRWLAYRVAHLQEHGQVPNYEASMSKAFGSEMQQRLARYLMSLTGLRGQLRAGSIRALKDGLPASYLLGAVPLTIAGGTSEIQRNIIATRGLGLPRG